MRSALVLLAALSLASLLAACGDDVYTSCELPRAVEVEALCYGNEGDPNSASTCVFRNSAQCSSRMCAMYQSSEPFCSEPCDLDAPDACPAGGICRPVPGESEGFCVSRSVMLTIE